MYDQREKARRDYEWAMAGARQEGLEEGLKEGREEGREEGRQERIALGILIGKVQVLQTYLGDNESPKIELLALSTAQLTALLADLQERLRSRET